MSVDDNHRMLRLGDAEELAQDRYHVLRLNTWATDSWAVIDSATGAIVEHEGSLLMKLSRISALRIANRLGAD